MRAFWRCVLWTSMAAVLAAGMPAYTTGARGIRPLPGIVFHPAVSTIGDLHALGTYIAERYPWRAATAVPQIRAMGVHWVREEFRADHLHSSARRPYDFKPYDHVVRLEHAAGLRILGLLDYNNTFHQGDHVSMPGDELVSKTNDFIKYVTAVVGHYRNIIRYWQVWNEPDIEQRWKPRPNANNYAYLLRRAYAAIKSVDPRDKVIMAGPTTGNDKHAVQFVYDVRRDRGRFDIVAFQPYTAIPGPSILAEVAALHKLGKPVWFTEIGWPGQAGCAPCSNPMTQANFLSAIYLIAAVSAVNHCFWFDYRDGGIRPDYGDHFGLVEYNFQRKPSYRAFQIRRNLLDNSTLVGVAQVAPSVNLYRFQRGGSSFYAMWNYGYTSESIRATWTQPFVNVESSTIQHVTGTYAGRLNMLMPALSVDYLVPPVLNLRAQHDLNRIVP